MGMFFSIIDFLIEIGNFLWSMPLVVALFATAIIYTIGNKGFQFTYFVHILKETFGKNVIGNKNSKKGISSFKAFCMALCNTLGVGNIAGVGVAIALGGPGAVFWIWISCLLAMIVKYGEITLGIKYREIDPDTGMYRGGIMWYVGKGLASRWKWIAILYAGFYMITAFNGPAVQVNSMAAAIITYIDIPPVLIGIATAVLMALVLLGGVVSLSNFAEKVVPFMAILYLLGTLFILCKYATSIPDAFLLIIGSAFGDIEAMAGGFGGATVAMAMRYGTARGFYSNGAGCGDAPFMHSSADVKHPGEQAIWGISEVFVDGIICTCTALVIIVTDAWQTGKIGVALSTEAFARGFGNQFVGGIFLSVILVAFAFTTVIAGAYIGEICMKYFFKNKKIHIAYRVMLCCAAVLGASNFFMEQLEKIWLLADFNSGIVTLLSVFTLLLMCKNVFASTEEYKRMIKK